MRKIVNCRGLLIGLAGLATLGIAACSANRAPSNAGPDNGRAVAPTVMATANAAGTTAPAPTGAPPSPSTTLVPMQTAQGGEFLSPSGNISCQVDYNYYGDTSAYCETGTPPQSVTMSPTGSYTTCTGEQCLSNAGIDTPTLAYGTATGVGPFVCVSATTGVTCTADGKGFQISRSGITPV